MHHYKTSQKYIMQVVRNSYYNSDIYLKDITYSFIIDLENYLRSPNGRNLANNAVMKHIQRLRKMVTLAYHIEWIDKNPFTKFKSTFEKVERGFLQKLNCKE